MPTSDARYLLDSNVFIEAHRRYYAFDLCPGFWDCIPRLFAADRLVSIDKVLAELATGDELNHWASTDAPKGLFATTRELAVATEFAAVMSWAQSNDQFLPAARAEFATVADGWLVAYAPVHDCTLVTHEAHRPEQRSRVPLPNVCIQFVHAGQTSETHGAVFNF